MSLFCLPESQAAAPAEGCAWVHTAQQARHHASESPQASGTASETWGTEGEGQKKGKERAVPCAGQDAESQGGQGQREKFYIVSVGVRATGHCSCLCKVKPASHGYVVHVPLWSLWMRVAREGKPSLPGTEGEVLHSFCGSACGWSQFRFVHGEASHCTMYWAKYNKQTCQRQREKFYIVCIGVRMASPCSCLCNQRVAGERTMWRRWASVVTVNASGKTEQPNLPGTEEERSSG